MKRKTKCGCDPNEWEVYCPPCLSFYTSGRYGPNGRALCLRCNHYRKCHAAKEKKK